MSNLKEHLADLIIIQHRQVLLFPLLQGRLPQTDIASLAVDNLAVVLDIIGFPKDNSSFTNDDAAEYFSRFWLKIRYYDFMFAAEAEEVIVTPEGLKFETQEIEDVVRLQAHKYLDWLYAQMDALRAGEYNIGSNAFYVSPRGRELMMERNIQFGWSAERNN